MNMMILRLNAGGLPMGWLTQTQAATLYAKTRILWDMGEPAVVLHGGRTTGGKQSRLALAPIVATAGATPRPVIESDVPALCNPLLFRRDDYRCLYCGERFPVRELTRDHIQPRCQDGADCWTNVVAACRRCNTRKGGRTPEQAGMPLLAIPFTPNRYEGLYLANRHIRGDQMAFLASRFSGQRCWCAA